MLYAFHQWKNFEKRLTFDEVKADYTKEGGASFWLTR